MPTQTTARMQWPLMLQSALVPAVITIAGTILMPLLVHQLPPINQRPVGAILLPMFYFPLLGLVIFRNPLVIALSASLAPSLNHLLTGQPSLGMLPILTLELAFFSLFCYALLGSRFFRFLSAPTAWIATKALLSLIPSIFNSYHSEPRLLFGSSLMTGIPGLIVLTVMNISLLGFRRRDD